MTDLNVTIKGVPCGSRIKLIDDPDPNYITAEIKRAAFYEGGELRYDVETRRIRRNDAVISDMKTPTGPVFEGG